MTSDVNEQATCNAIEGLYRAFTLKDIDLLRTVVTEDWEYIPEPPGAAPGPEQMVKILKNIATALPDMRIEILDVLIDKEKVGVRAEVTGTQSGILLGIAPTSKEVSFFIHSFHQMRGSLIAKTWHLEDWLSVFRQLGQLPQALDMR